MLYIMRHGKTEWNKKKNCRAGRIFRCAVRE